MKKKVTGGPGAAAQRDFRMGSLWEQESTDGCAPSADPPTHQTPRRTDTRGLVSLPLSARPQARGFEVRHLSLSAENLPLPFPTSLPSFVSC